MIRAHFGLQKNPFDVESLALLAHQQEVFDILKVHAQQGGLCLVLGEPGTGKSVVKQALFAYDPKRVITPVVNRTLHTYHNTLRILCEAFQIEFEGRDHRCERLLVQQAFSVHRAGLGHNTFSPEALALIVRSGEGLLRRTRNLCLSSLIQAVRDQTRSVDLKQVNRVLIQPHWRKDYDNPLP